MNGIFTTMDGDKGARRRGIISAVAAAAMLLHVRTAPIRWRRLAVLCAVGAVGCVCGATLAQNMNLTLLRRIFAWVLIASGAVSFLKKEPDAKKIKKTLYK